MPYFVLKHYDQGRAAIYFRWLIPTIMDPEEFHFRVRYGNGWSISGIATLL